MSEDESFDRALFSYLDSLDPEGCEECENCGAMIHPDDEELIECEECGRYLCSSCILTIGEYHVCRECDAKYDDK